MSNIKSKFTLHPDYTKGYRGQERVNAELEKWLPPSATLSRLYLNLAVLLIMLGAVLYFSSKVLEEYLYITDGERILASVILCENTRDGIRITYTYYAFAQTLQKYENSLVIGDMPYCIRKSGGYVDVIYIRSDPARVRADFQLNRNAPDLSLGIPVGLLVCVAIALNRVIAIYRAMSLRRNRGYRPGEITAIKGYVSDKTADYIVRLSYRFTSPDGTLCHGNDEAPRPDLKDKELPPLETPIVVIYIHNNAHMVL